MPYDPRVGMVNIYGEGLVKKEIGLKTKESVRNPSAVRWLGTVLDGQTDCFKTDRIRLSVVNPSAVRWLGTVLDGQTDCFKT